jgi:lysophospholipase L1-like esterase
MTRATMLASSLAVLALTSGCGGEDDAERQGEVFTNQFYAADDPDIVLTGRIDSTNPQQIRFSAPGVYIEARFRGTGLSATLVDQHLYGKYQNYFDVVIDDGAPTKLAVSADQTNFVLASGLAPGEHTVLLAKRTESSIGYTEFAGFTIQGEILPAPERPSRRIVFIGDSITCGSGSEAKNGSPECEEDGWGQPYNNAHLAYGPVLARALDAEYQVTAVSGIGLVRNYSSMYDARPMPEVYDLTFLESMNRTKIWDTSAFVPDAVVIALGTNDFSPGDSERENMDIETFAEAYVAFVETLRGYYPDAHFFAVSSPMLGNGWPKAADTFLDDQRAAIAEVARHFGAAGDDKVHEFVATKLSGTGCGTHPSVEQHASMAAELGHTIKATMGW